MECGGLTRADEELLPAPHSTLQGAKSVVEAPGLSLWVSWRANYMQDGDFVCFGRLGAGQLLPPSALLRPRRRRCSSTPLGPTQPASSAQACKTRAFE